MRFGEELPFDGRLNHQTALIFCQINTYDISPGSRSITSPRVMRSFGTMSAWLPDPDESDQLQP